MDGPDAVPKGSPSLSSLLFWRQFHRGSTPNEDILADTAFLDRNFKDPFGMLLREVDLAQFQTFNEVLLRFWHDPKYKLQIFCVADGGGIMYNATNANWFDPHVRFLAVVTSNQHANWTLFIVGSDVFDSGERFLQAASWDGSAYRFYGRETLNLFPISIPVQHSAWIYQGNSSDAFGPDTSYLGPFSGHVNGAPIMKELRKPWLHWNSTAAGIDDCLSPSQRHDFGQREYLSLNPSQVLSRVSLANDLESIVVRGIQQFSKTRLDADFKSGGNLSMSPSNIPRWMAHLLLTTTVNIRCGLIQSDESISVPAEHFFNAELLSNSKLAPHDTNYTVSKELYDQACKALDLALLQEVDSFEHVPADLQTTLYPGALGAGKDMGSHAQVKFARALDGEGGNGPFTILTPSIEDVIGVLKFQKITPVVSLISPKAFDSLIMVDFWNPIYSWRRGILMQYMPTSTTFSPETQEYDLESKFIDALGKSPWAGQPFEPEHDFLQLYNDYKPDKWAKDTAKYAELIKKNLKNADHVLAYMELAESRRRIYRPLPLNEFGFTLPFAVKYSQLDQFLLKEMTSSATVVNMPQRGVDFITAWTATLWTNNPNIVAKASLSARNTESMQDGLAPRAPSALPMKERTPVDLTSFSARKKAQGCPVMQKAAKAGPPPGPGPAPPPRVPLKPTWEADVSQLFRCPWWIEEKRHEHVGQHWVEAMKYWGPLDLSSYEAVRGQARTIYNHLRSRSMPITKNGADFWPQEALETFRQWANQGFRATASDPIVYKLVIPRPAETEGERFRVRKDIRDLTVEELAEYRARLDDVMQVGCLESLWQEFGHLHAEWCFHYQEAFSLWHRASLIYIENLIDFPIPYWNCTDPCTGDPDSSLAGIPPMFLVETYTHPSKGTRPNPLRYALARNGQSKAGNGERYVTRDPTLVKGPGDRSWRDKISRFKIYHAQVASALEQATFSQPAGITMGSGCAFGIPWANLPAFSDMQPDNLYPYRADFDGLFEQAHDNWHGWVGPDMADNAYTAFDPIFLSYHCNIDRVVSKFIAAHPESQFTSNFLLRPFTDLGKKLNYDDPRAYAYTTVGDMAKDTRALGYMYAPPNSSEQDLAVQLLHAHPGSHKEPLPTGGTGVSLLPPISVLTRIPASYQPATLEDLKQRLQAAVVFENIACTVESYAIDVFVGQSPDLTANIETNRLYIGCITRLGMGTDVVRQRCRRAPVTRVLWIAKELEGDVNRCGIQQVVTKLPAGEVVEEDEWIGWTGFTGELRWLLRAME